MLLNRFWFWPAPLMLVKDRPRPENVVWRTGEDAARFFVASVEGIGLRTDVGLSAGAARPASGPGLPSPPEPDSAAQSSAPRPDSAGGDTARVWLSSTKPPYLRVKRKG